eukprot:TRINITY_DN780108_c0_g1_i1.p1 TRINITY_DN780108_c0_g1~~TRINITY_DN780108_c0_g1_i1.p1  ORF type:complete len:212 (-),score=33.84 TRINITY_DN780108_c0_g1_i1:106-741(-)
MECEVIGKHCEYPSCNLRDFLPFTCDGCRKVFCLEHRSYATHECINSSNKDKRVIICPLCKDSVLIGPHEDETIAFHRHEITTCKPHTRKSKKKKRCPVEGCKEKLTRSNKESCADCSQEFCLRHRFPDDHDCVGPPVVKKRGLFSKLKKKVSSNSSSSNSTPSKKDTSEKCSNCGQVLPDLKSLILHVKTKHPKKPKEEPKKKSNKLWFF